uniref:Uncharacterized protein n=1 Tax=Rhizophagus irregularis (strain DAOM 181602 / DAOM 197198 / MUCL 43194) TaxID=747089 RepID=U9U8H8_RHIID
MSKNILLFRLFVFLNCVFQIFGQISYDLPAGWFRDGDTQYYDIGVDYATFYEKAPSGFLKSHPNISSLNSDLHSTLAQGFIPKDYLGKQVRLTCFMKYSNVLSSIDLSGLLFTGSGDWTKFENVVNVPEDTSLISFGAILNDEGVVWLDKCNFEIVEPPDESVSFPFPKFEPNVNNNDFHNFLTYPINLDF